MRDSKRNMRSLTNACLAAAVCVVAAFGGASAKTLNLQSKVLTPRAQELNIPPPQPCPPGWRPQAGHRQCVPDCGSNQHVQNGQCVLNTNENLPKCPSKAPGVWPDCKCLIGNWTGSNCAGPGPEACFWRENNGTPLGSSGFCHFTNTSFPPLGSPCACQGSVGNKAVVHHGTWVAMPREGGPASIIH